MGSLADFIEQYLRGVLLQKKMVELQRRDLAKMFRCAPSQINYVLETRFSLDRGFIVESKRGGGGYIRITQITWQTEDFPQLIRELVPEELDENETELLLGRLTEGKIISEEAAQLILKMTDEFAGIPEDYAGYLRAKFLKALLMVLGSKSEE